METPSINKKTISLKMGNTDTVTISGTKRKVNWVVDDITIASYIAYAFDFCGGSTRTRSTGLKTTEMTIFTEKSDLLAVFDYFEKMSGVDRNRIYIMGGSQGGLVTALAAEELKDRARAMALYFPALGIPDNWRKTYPDVNKIPTTVNLMGMNLGKNFFVSMHDLSTFNVIGGFEKPVFILHGNKDTMVPLSDSQRAVKIYKNAKLKIMEGEGHGFRPAAGKIAMEEVLKFMEENK